MQRGIHHHLIYWLLYLMPFKNVPMWLLSRVLRRRERELLPEGTTPAGGEVKDLSQLQFGYQPSVGSGALLWCADIDAGRTLYT